MSKNKKLITLKNLKNKEENDVEIEYNSIKTDIEKEEELKIVKLKVLNNDIQNQKDNKKSINIININDIQDIKKENIIENNNDDNIEYDIENDKKMKKKTRYNNQNDNDKEIDNKNNVENDNESDNKNKIDINKYNLLNEVLSKNNDISDYNLIKYETDINKNTLGTLDYQDNSFEYNNIQLYNIINYAYLEKINNIDNYNSLILIIDNNYDKNSSFFIKSIILKFKQYQNFLIVQNYNDNDNKNKDEYRILLNDQYLIKENLNENECLSFIEENKEKIQKIFINHIKNISYNFLNIICSYGKQIGSITHDYSLIIMDNINYITEFNDFNKYIDKNIFDLNNLDFIITQNIKNFNIFKYHVKTEKKIILSEPPDFKLNDIRINTNNNKIIIGIIGNIDKKNGKNILQLLYDNYKYDKNIEFIVFGYCDISNITCVSYNTINEFNDLLIKYKPNILLELSIHPETYSYTLNLSMLTNLPILSLLKNYDCTVENYLLKYDKTYYFSTIDEFNKLINKYKQNFFYTIKSTLYYSSFWEEFFVNKQKIIYKIIDDNKITNIDKDKINNIINKNIVIITSKIKTSKYNFINSSSRSIYTNEERFKQTIDTINSVKKYIPDYYIILFDNSNFSTDEYNLLDKSVDKFINITDDYKLNHNTNICDLKTVAQLSQHIKLYNVYIKYIDFSKNKNIFVISGRNTLNNFFKYENFNNDKNIFKEKYIDVESSDNYYSCFYKLYNNVISYFYNELKRNLDIKKYDELNIDINKIFSDIIKIKTIETLGISYNNSQTSNMVNI